MACATTIVPLSRDEAMNRRLLDYNPEAETYEATSPAVPVGVSSEAVFSEMDEMELAVGLLGVTTHAELESFLGDVINQAGRVIGKAVPPLGGSALASILTAAAKQSLPVVDGVLEHRPSQTVSAAAKYLGLELEGLSPEDQEFEAAKQFIRFAGDATKNAVASPVSMSPQAAATQAARRYAPGLRGGLAGAAPPADAPPADGPTGTAQSGRWVRRGPNIIVISS
jgi:hypothetical protein